MDYNLLNDQVGEFAKSEAWYVSLFSNTAALLYEAMPDVNWVGFYIKKDDDLLVGPFCGKVACIRIKPGKGVCGTALVQDRVLRVSDVHEFPGHIACDAASRSEIVIPIHHNGSVFGVLDIDSPKVSRFNEADEKGLLQIVSIIEESFAKDAGDVEPELSATDDPSVREKYRRITEKLIEKQLTITTMESCTAGMIASLITDTEGSSAVIKGAFVTYSNEAKELQGINSETISQYGVYSKETAAEMAACCKRIYSADIGIGVTGSFGNPDPNNPDSVPGEVYFAIAYKEGTDSFSCTLPTQKDRHGYKLYMADLIADGLSKLL